MYYNTAMKIVYADLLVITNLLFDYILLLLASRLCSQRPQRLRLLLASAAGAAYALACCIDGSDFLPSPGGKILSCAVICLIAFYGRPNFARQCAVFLAMSAAMGGALWALGLSGGYSVSLCGAFCGISLAVYLGLSDILSPQNSELMSIEIEFNSRRCCLSALHDTGNSLTDPVSGDHVIVVTPAALKGIIPGLAQSSGLDDGVALLQYFDLFPDTRGKFRLIPFRALGKGGLVPAFRPDRLRINGKDAVYLVAISSEVQGKLYEGIV